MNCIHQIVCENERFGAVFRIEPLISPPEAEHLFDAVGVVHFEKQRPDTSLSPGHSPPQVTMPARVSGGLKNRFSRAPANSKRRSSAGGASTVRTIVAGTRSESLTQRLRGDG